MGWQHASSLTFWLISGRLMGFLDWARFQGHFKSNLLVSIITIIFLAFGLAWQRYLELSSQMRINRTDLANVCGYNFFDLIKLLFVYGLWCENLEIWHLLPLPTVNKINVKRFYRLKQRTEIGIRRWQKSKTKVHSLLVSVFHLPRNSIITMTIAFFLSQLKL